MVPVASTWIRSWMEMPSAIHEMATVTSQARMPRRSSTQSGAAMSGATTWRAA